MSGLTRTEVAHVAKLARLRLSDEELDLFTVQLARILDHAADMQSLDLADVIAPLLSQRASHAPCRAACRDFAAQC